MIETQKQLFQKILEQSNGTIVYDANEMLYKISFYVICLRWESDFKDYGTKPTKPIDLQGSKGKGNSRNGFLEHLKNILQKNVDDKKGNVSYNKRLYNKEIPKLPTDSNTLGRFLQMYENNVQKPRYETRFYFSVFCGFHGWEDFEYNYKQFLNEIPQFVEIQKAHIDGGNKATPKIKNFKKKIFYFVSAFLFFAIFLVVIFFNPNYDEKNSTTKKILKLIEAKIKDNRVFLSLEYELNNTSNVDTVRLNIGGKHYTIPHNSTKNIGKFDVTCYTPIDEISLINNKTNQIIDFIKVPMKTTGWVGYVNCYGLKNDCVFDYKDLVNPVDTTKGIMSITVDTMLNYEEKKYFYTTLMNYKDFQVNGDKCEVEIRLKGVKKLPKAECMMHYFRVIGTEKEATFSLEKNLISCVMWCRLSLGNDVFKPNCMNETYEHMGTTKTYKCYNAEKFLLPDSVRTNWHTLKMTLKDKKAYFYVNNKLLHEPLNYTGKIGMIRGIVIHFKGAGAVDWVRIRDGKDKEVYYDDFEK